MSGYYDKHHLVPFGEYIPLERFLGILRGLLKNVGRFKPGRRGEVLREGPAPLGVLICYESIFPELGREQVAAGARLLLNITNDSWFGRTSAPYQHLAHLALRCVENRVSAARSARTGISCFVDPTGRIFGRSGLFETYSGAARLPLLGGGSFYTRVGHYFDWLILLLAGIIVLAGMVIKRRTGDV